MSRFYIDELKKLGSVSDDGISSDDTRHEQWKNEREKFGFDGRDTWSLDFTMTEMLYERLQMYMVKADEIVNLSYHTYDFGGKTYTQREIILEMINDAETFLKFEYDAIDELNEDDFNAMTEDEMDAHLEIYGQWEIKALHAKRRLWLMWAVVQHQMWW